MFDSSTIKVPKTAGGEHGCPARHQHSHDTAAETRMGLVLYSIHGVLNSFDCFQDPSLAEEHSWRLRWMRRSYMLSARFSIQKVFTLTLYETLLGRSSWVRRFSSLQRLCATFSLDFLMSFVCRAVLLQADIVEAEMVSVRRGNPMISLQGSACTIFMHTAQATRA